LSKAAISGEASRLLLPRHRVTPDQHYELFNAIDISWTNSLPQIDAQSWPITNRMAVMPMLAFNLSPTHNAAAFVKCPAGHSHDFRPSGPLFAGDRLKHVPPDRHLQDRPIAHVGKHVGKRLLERIDRHHLGQQFTGRRGHLCQPKHRSPLAIVFSISAPSMRAITLAPVQ
jgi:hypothetical protein